MSSMSDHKTTDTGNFGDSFVQHEKVSFNSFSYVKKQLHSLNEEHPLLYPSIKYTVTKNGLWYVRQKKFVFFKRQETCKTVIGAVKDSIANYLPKQIFHKTFVLEFEKVIVKNEYSYDNSNRTGGKFVRLIFFDVSPKVVSDSTLNNAFVSSTLYFRFNFRFYDFEVNKHRNKDRYYELFNKPEENFLMVIPPSGKFYMPAKIPAADLRYRDEILNVVNGFDGKPSNGSEWYKFLHKRKELEPYLIGNFLEEGHMSLEAFYRKNLVF